MKTVLTIAGSDPSGGAGIQADLKTFAAFGVYGMSVITALTVQNTTGVKRVFPVPEDLFEEQLEAVLCDIPPDAVKIGMMPDKNIIGITARLLEKYGIKNIVCDTVMISTSGKRLMDEGSSDMLRDEIMKRSDIVTPNIPEAEIFSGMEINSSDSMKKAAEVISSATGAAVVLKGGHLKNSADDILFIPQKGGNGKYFEFRSERINNPNTHGTGCTFSSAAACGLAAGKSVYESVLGAKRYITEAIRARLDLGHGNGPLDHLVKI